jgi:hypothetical protein
VLSSAVDVETLQTRILAGFQTTRNRPGISDRLQVAIRLPAEAGRRWTYEAFTVRSFEELSVIDRPYKLENYVISELC